jgi:23S rRNA (uracil1939-C5)-methyltransferase
MRETVARYASLAEDDIFIDGACGVGFFALDLARRAASGTGYDIERENIRWARHNAKKNGIATVKFETRDLSKLEETGGTFGAVVVDPPRAGLSKKARRGIAFLEPRAIVCVSCNPSTFARDATYFSAAGYVLRELTFIDMFPGTRHIELIARFARE